MENNIQTLKNLKILYVEDEEFAREEMIMLLSYVFKKVVSAKDGNEGLNNFLENKDEIDIILSDINMPNLNGIDMVKEIKKNTKDIPIVFLTAHNDNNYLFQAINLGVSQYIIKPMNNNELFEKLYNAYLPILQRKQIEEKNIELEKLNAQILKESKEKIERIEKEQARSKSINDLFNAHTITLDFDLKGVITYASRSFLSLSGFSKNELIGHTIDIVRQKEFKDTFEQIKKSVLRENYWFGEIQNKKKTGELYLIDSVVFPVLNKDEQIEGFKSIEVDITNMKKLMESVGSIVEHDVEDFEFITNKTNI